MARSSRGWKTRGLLILIFSCVWIAGIEISEPAVLGQDLPFSGPQALWRAYTNALQTDDKKGALQYISILARDKYRQIFKRLPPEAFKALWKGTLRCPGETFGETKYIKCELLRTQEDGRVYSDSVIIVKDLDGLWRIQQF